MSVPDTWLLLLSVSNSNIYLTLTLAVLYRWSATGNGSLLESLGFREGYKIDVDVPEGTWVEAPNFHDVLIFNTGHW